MSDPILLGIPGALRKASTNRLLLKEAARAFGPCDYVEADIDFLARHVDDLTRELRVARVDDARIEIVPAQVHLVGREDDFLRTRLLFLADIPAESSATYLILYGNADAPATKPISQSLARVSPSRWKTPTTEQ